MKILMVGTGAIGSIYAKVLSEKYEVTHYVREEKLEKRNLQTIPYDIVDERLDRKNQSTKGTYTYHCVTRADDSYDLIIVPVKTQQLTEVLKTLKAQALNADYLLFTLDWQSGPEIDAILEKSQYVLGYSGGGGTFKSDLLWANVGKDIMLGTAHPEQQELLDKVKQIFEECGIMPETPNNATHWLWIHNVSSAPFGAALVCHSDVNSLVADKKLTKLSFRAMRECFEICEKRGVDLSQFGEVGMYKLPLWMLYVMFRLNFKLNPAMQRYTAHAIDCLDEMKINFMDIYNSGRALGVNMPGMTELKTLIA